MIPSPETSGCALINDVKVFRRLTFTVHVPEMFCAPDTPIAVSVKSLDGRPGRMSSAAVAALRYRHRQRRRVVQPAGAVGQAVTVRSVEARVTSTAPIGMVAPVLRTVKV